MKKKKDDNTGIVIPGFLLTGIGTGFLFMDRIPMAIPAFTLIGLGLGFLTMAIMAQKQ